MEILSAEVGNKGESVYGQVICGSICLRGALFQLLANMEASGKDAEPSAIWIADILIPSQIF